MLSICNPKKAQKKVLPDAPISTDTATQVQNYCVWASEGVVFLTYQKIFLELAVLPPPPPNYVETCEPMSNTSPDVPLVLQWAVAQVPFYFLFWAVRGLLGGVCWLCIQVSHFVAKQDQNQLRPEPHPQTETIDILFFLLGGLIEWWFENQWHSRSSKWRETRRTREPNPWFLDFILTRGDCERHQRPSRRQHNLKTERSNDFHRATKIETKI